MEYDGRRWKIKNKIHRTNVVRIREGERRMRIRLNNKCNNCKKHIGVLGGYCSWMDYFRGRFWCWSCFNKKECVLMEKKEK